MANLPDNMKEALESERVGLKARLDAVDDDTPADTVAMLKRRIAEVGDALGDKPAAKKAASRAKEKRPE